MTKVRQFYITEANANVNIVQGMTVLSLGIHALPGTRFQLNQGRIIMNNLGNLTMDCTSFPITDLRVLDIVSGQYPIIIDILYMEG